MRRVLTLLFAVVLAGLVASPAAALVPATTIDDVVVSLQTDPVPTTTRRRRTR